MGIDGGGTLTNYLNGLIASDFVLKYVPFGYGKKESYYKFADPFCLFYLNFPLHQGENEDYFSQNYGGYKINSWLGRAFENLCFNHVPQIKFALGISGVNTSYSAFHSKENGMQIDMVLSRKDNVIDLCEMKFYSIPFHVDKECFFTVNRRNEAVRAVVSKKTAVRNTIIASYGLEKSDYWGVFTSVITLDDLFRF